MTLSAGFREAGGRLGIEVPSNAKLGILAEIAEAAERSPYAEPAHGEGDRLSLDQFDSAERRLEMHPIGTPGYDPAEQWAVVGAFAARRVRE